MTVLVSRSKNAEQDLRVVKQDHPTLTPANKLARKKCAKPSLVTSNPLKKRWDRVIIMDERCLKLEENTSAGTRLLVGEKSEDYSDYLYRLPHLLQGVDENLNWWGLL